MSISGTKAFIIKIAKISAVKTDDISQNAAADGKDNLAFAGHGRGYIVRCHEKSPEQQAAGEQMSNRLKTDIISVQPGDGSQQEKG